MAIEQINLGTVVQDGADGDVARVAFTKVNANFADLESRKVDKVAGKQLSTEDYTSSEKIKLGGIEQGAQVNVPTNLAQGARTSTTVLVTSSTGTSATLQAASTTVAGLQTAADKVKLDGIEQGAQVNTVTSVAGKTGAVTLAKADVGLGNVDNTSDANKPVSTATQAALDLKANTSTQIIAGTGLTGGGTLAANRTLAVSYGNTAGTAAQGNDSRLSDAREWAAETVAQAEAEAGTATTRRAWTAQRVRQAVVAWWASVEATKANSNDTRLTDSREWAAETVTQAEAEAGTATTRRAWTAQRVRQAVVAWWNGVSSAWGTGFVGSANAAAGRTALELGNAATRAVQTSPTDTTAGALMAVGAFGLGSFDLPVLADLDNRLTRPGFYRCAVITGAPSEYGVVHIVSRATGYPDETWVHQVFYDTLGNVHNRYSTNFTPWSPWRRMYHSGNVVGAVSQSGGIPTGAIIERGSNANGRFTRYADGTVIMDNSGNAITTNPTTTVGAVTSVDANKLRYGFWY